MGAGEWDDESDEPYGPDWHCIKCGESGLREDGPVEAECPHYRITP